jgi:hypothetical protein
MNDIYEIGTENTAGLREIDGDYVIIPLERYDDLITAETTLDILITIFHKAGIYRCEDVLNALFPKTEQPDTL